MSGYCDFCGVWHSGTCCHPKRIEFDALRDERDAARAECERLRVDAERWRLMRTKPPGFTIEVMEYDDDGCEEWVSGHSPEELDAAIDAARTK